MILNFNIDRIKVVDLEILVEVKKVQGELEKTWNKLTIDAKQSISNIIDLPKGNYRIEFTYNKITMCNDCEYFCEKVNARINIYPNW